MTEEIMLNYLGRAYFHQDYDLDAPSPPELVKRFAEEDGEDYVQIMVDELSTILRSGLTESEARHLWLRDARAMYDPAKDGKSYLEWLTEICDIATEVLARRLKNSGESEY